ncbi:MAG: hypothetical protein ACFCVK_21940 [Acidimicrobiales bacterium]
MVADDERRPTDQLVDLLVYAPIGLLYEYDEVLATLVRRGKSQVQLARLLGQVAVGRGQTGVEGAVNEVATAVGSLVARAITEVGVAVGLAPQPVDQPLTIVEVLPAETGEAPDDHGRPADPGPEAGGPAGDEAGSLPIVGYDDLTAREVIPLLEDLTESQRRRVRDHEMAGRSRKTILAKLDRLGD